MDPASVDPIGDIFRLDLEAKLQEDGHSAYGPVKGSTPGSSTATASASRASSPRRSSTNRHEFTENELTDKDVPLGVTPKSQWKDVYVNCSYFKKAQIQLGKFKVPFGLDELTGVTHNDFVYRSLGGNYLDPGRDIGAMVHGIFFKHGFDLRGGRVQHDGDNARSKKSKVATPRRVTHDASPFRRFTTSTVGNIDVGNALHLDSARPRDHPRAGLTGGAATVMTMQDDFYESVYVKGHRRRWEADAIGTRVRRRSRAEYTWVSDDRLAQGIGDQNLPNARARSWYVSGNLGADRRGPRNGRSRSGAPVPAGGPWRDRARRSGYERMWFDSTPTWHTTTPLRNPRAETILPSGDKALTLGVSWTLNRFTKLQFNGIREHHRGSRNVIQYQGADAFWSRVIRLQFVL